MDQGLKRPLSPHETRDRPSQPLASACGSPSNSGPEGRRTQALAVTPVPQEGLGTRFWPLRLALLCVKTWAEPTKPPVGQGSPREPALRSVNPAGEMMPDGHPGEIPPTQGHLPWGTPLLTEAEAVSALGSMAPRDPSPLWGSLCPRAQPWSPGVGSEATGCPGGWTKLPGHLPP